MKKPHEQEWTKDEHQMGRIQATAYVSLDVRVASHRHPDGDSAALREGGAVVDLALAAPDMARALLAHGTEDVRGVWHSRKCIAMGREALCSDECRMDRAALRKAGVLP